jgi:CRP-like cAMP-binding protein
MCSLHYEVKKVQKNQFLLQYGEVCRYIYFVEKGLLKMYSIDKTGKSISFSLRRKAGLLQTVFILMKNLFTILKP